MKIEIKGTMLNLVHLAKTAEENTKTGKAYSMHKLSFIDDEGGVFSFNLSKDLVADTKLVNKLLDIKNQEVVLTLNIWQKGYSLSGQVIGVEL